MDGSDKKRSEQQRQGQEQAQEQLLRLRRSTHTARNPRPTIRGRGQDEGFTHPSIRGEDKTRDSPTRQSENWDLENVIA
jgi:hypothetical protein